MQANQALEPLLRGDPVEAMEAAKQIIGKKIAHCGDLQPRLSRRTLSRTGAAADTLGPEGTDRRQSAAKALGNIGDPAALPALDKTLRHETSPSLRKSCAYALEEIDSPEPV